MPIILSSSMKNLDEDRGYIWDQDGLTHTSEPVFWTTGLFHESDWKAKWIGLDQAIGDDDPDAPHRKLSSRMLRHEFEVEKKIRSVTAFVSGLGLFEMYINGYIEVFGQYRWHVLDSLRFDKDLKITIQSLGWGPDGYLPPQGDLASATYWYQIEPHQSFPKLPSNDKLIIKNKK